MAKHFMFTAEKISANEAVSCGLVQKLVAEENLETFVNDYAFTISKNAPLTIKAMKQIGIEILKNPLESLSKFTVGDNSDIKNKYFVFFPEVSTKSESNPTPIIL